MSRLRAIVAIPVRNEEERVEACLASLAAQKGLAAGDIGILLFLNNCTDGTEAVVRRSAIEYPWETRIVSTHSLRATAGWARRAAMDAAAQWLDECPPMDDVILTTDADTRVGPTWVRRNLEIIAAGSDAVAGRFTLDPAEAARLPARLHARGRNEGAYDALLTEISARLAPDPRNPWPCHRTASGATLAVRRATYLRVGGMPALAAGEDRAFIEALRNYGARVRHAPDVEVVTSARLDGRARGGAADTMQLRCDAPESACDDRLEPLARVVRRHLRRKEPTSGKIGKAAKEPLRPRDLPREIRLARVLVNVLRLRDRVRVFVLR